MDLILDEEIGNYLNEFPRLYREEKWEEIVNSGEKALAKCLKLDGSLTEERFSILEQLVSTYFRLGNVEKAKEHVYQLRELADHFKKPAFRVQSLYKLSAVQRCEAGSAPEKNPLYEDARKEAHKALELQQKECPKDTLLKAKVLYNVGAVECEDPKGDCKQGLSAFSEALALFIPLQQRDYISRTRIRIGRAHLLLNAPLQSREIISALQKAPLEGRLKLLLSLLEVQQLQAEKQFEESEKKAQEGCLIAEKLHAALDKKRLEKLLKPKSIR